MSIPTLAVYPLVQRGIKDKSIGSGYDPTQTYSKDALIYKGGKVYIAKQNDITGPWNPLLWDEVDILSILEEVMSKAGSLSAIGRYLSDWNCQTGLPSTNPATIPYEYVTGDYYIIGNVTTGTNYMPSGTSYTGDASTTVDSGNPQVLDMYRYDGTTWTLLRFGNAFRAFLANYYTKGEADTRYAGKLVLTAAENKTVNGCVVPKLTDIDLTTIYNAVVAGKSVVIADATEMMFFEGINTDVVSNEIFVSFRYFNRMVLEYGEGNTTTFVNLYEEIVPAYDTTQTYNIGTIVSHDGKIYIANSNNITGGWDVTKWNLTNLAEIISATKAKAQTVTIAVADWLGGTTCTKSVTGVTTTSIVIVDTSDGNVECTGQGAGTLTFTATSTPTSAVTVKVVIL